MSAQRMRAGETREAYVGRALAFCRRHYKRLRDSQDYPPHCSHDASDTMQACEKLFPDLGTFGVEGFCSECGQYGVSYLNTGDTYGLTILFVSTPRTDRWSIGDWGSIVECSPEGRYR